MGNDDKTNERALVSELGPAFAKVVPANDQNGRFACELPGELAHYSPSIGLVLVSMGSNDWVSRPDPERPT